MYMLERGRSLNKILILTVNLDVQAGTNETSAERDLISNEEGSIPEPHVAMEFESEEAAKEFYDQYARRVGFVMRIDQCRRSEADQRILSRRLSCNKQGFYLKAKQEFGPARKPRTSTREGCKAMMLVKADKSGKWTVTRFVKDHTHPLVVSHHPPIPNTVDAKDKRIQELTTELEHQDRLCNLYRGLLFTFMKNFEEQTELLSTKVEVVVNNVREFEAGIQKLSQNG